MATAYSHDTLAVMRKMQKTENLNEMGVGLLIGFFLLPCFTYFLYLAVYLFQKKKIQSRNCNSLLAITCLLSILFTNNIDELTISKEDVKKDLKQIDIELNANFEIRTTLFQVCLKEIKQLKLKYPKNRN